MKNEGYLLIDHRASPGMPADFYRKLGMDAPAVGEGKMLESHTLTCKHCNTPVILNPERVRARGHCRKCDGYICDPCVALRDCTPFSKILDQAESQAYRAQQNNLALGFSLRKKELNHG